MELLIVRHGPAGEAAEWARSGRPDAERPLTRDGRRKTARAALGLARIAGKVGLVASSPWRRAEQTGALVAKACGARAVACPALTPDHPYGDLLDWLKTRREKRVALVGHEPHLGRFVSWLLTGKDRPLLRLKKSQALLLELERPEPGGAVLIWSIAPRQLRALT